jgi:hypothetical protein
MPELQEHRLVLFAGPSAGPSIRNFFIQHATNGEREDPLDSLTNWTWPYHPRANDVNAFADLLGDRSVSFAVNQDRRRELLSTLLAVWGHARTDPERHNHEHYLIPYDVNNVFLGHEEWARFGETPLSKLNGMDAIQTVLDLLQPKDFSIVVTHAAKLSEHWLSLVEPFASVTSYRDFVCSSYTSWDQGSIRLFEKAHSEYANSVANPLGLAVELRKHGWPVVLVDLEGVATAGLDPAHTIACEILNAPCHEGWVKGLSRQPSAVHPQATRPMTGLSQVQLDEIEWIFRQRECAYRHILWDDAGVQILQRGNSIWADCSTKPTEWQRSLLNTTTFLEELYAQVGCSKLQTQPNVHSTRTGPWRFALILVFSVLSVRRVFRRIRI